MTTLSRSNKGPHKLKNGLLIPGRNQGREVREDVWSDPSKAGLFYYSPNYFKQQPDSGKSCLPIWTYCRVRKNPHLHSMTNLKDKVLCHLRLHAAP